MQKRRVLINAVMSSIQIVVISVVLFLLYKFLLKTIGVKQLGVWSLILATTSVTQIANFGLSGSIVKFVAKYIARREIENVSLVLQTATISISAMAGFILLIAYPFARWVLRLVISTESLELALSILPYAFFSLWVMMITSIFQAGLDGYQRIDIRSCLLMGGAILHLVLCLMLAPTYGLIGVAYARIIQNLVIFLSSWLLLKRYLPLLPVFPYKWNKGLFKEIIGYGINFQVISIASIFYDPITKALMSKFDGLSMVGYYEMASRMIQQFRALIVSANQVLVPAIANLKEKSPAKIQSVYLTTYQLIFYLSLPLFSMTIISAPIISELWIGYYENSFIVFGTLLAAGWFLNTLNSPAFFANLGVGELRWNVVSHIAIALLNTCLGFSLGLIYGGIGVVVAWVISLSLGSSIVYLSYHINHRIPLAELLPRESRIIVAACLSAIALAFIARHSLVNRLNAVELESLIFFLPLIVIFIPIWIHPMRKRVVKLILFEIINKERGKKGGLHFPFFIL